MVSSFEGLNHLNCILHSRVLPKPFGDLRTISRAASVSIIVVPLKDTTPCKCIKPFCLPISGTHLYLSRVGGLPSTYDTFGFSFNKRPALKFASNSLLIFVSCINMRFLSLISVRVLCDMLGLIVITNADFAADFL